MYRCGVRSKIDPILVHLLIIDIYQPPPSSSIWMSAADFPIPWINDLLILDALHSQPLPYCRKNLRSKLIHSGLDGSYAFLKFQVRVFLLLFTHTLDRVPSGAVQALSGDDCIG